MDSGSRPISSQVIGNTSLSGDTALMAKGIILELSTSARKKSSSLCPIFLMKAKSWKVLSILGIDVGLKTRNLGQFLQYVGRARRHTGGWGILSPTEGRQQIEDNRFRRTDCEAGVVTIATNPTILQDESFAFSVFLFSFHPSLTSALSPCLFLAGDKL